MSIKFLEKTSVQVVLALVIALAIGIAIGVHIGRADTTQSSKVIVPFVCPEDAVIVGKGEYNPVYGWDRYACVASDNF